MEGGQGRGFLFVAAALTSYFLEDGCLGANRHVAAVGQSMGTCIACSEAASVWKALPGLPSTRLNFG